MMNVMTPSLSTNHIRGSDLLRGGVMAQQELAVTNVSMLRRVPQGAARSPRQHADPKWPGLFFFRGPVGFRCSKCEHPSKRSCLASCCLRRIILDGQRLEGIVSLVHLRSAVHCI